MNLLTRVLRVIEEAQVAAARRMGVQPQLPSVFGECPIPTLRSPSSRQRQTSRGAPRSYLSLSWVVVPLHVVSVLCNALQTLVSALHRRVCKSLSSPYHALECWCP